MWNPFEHFEKLVYGNAFGGAFWGLESPDTIHLPDGQIVPAAVPGHPESLQYYLRFGEAYEPITQDQAFVQQLWLHAKYGAAAPGPESASQFYVQLGLADAYSITPDAMRAAVQSLPHVAADITATGMSEADVWAYTQAEAPWAVALVGIA